MVMASPVGALPIDGNPAIAIGNSAQAVEIVHEIVACRIEGCARRSSSSSRTPPGSIWFLVRERRFRRSVNRDWNNQQLGHCP